MTAAERGVLLLCASLDSADRPLTMAQFRELSLRAQAMGRPEGDLSAELTQKDVERLGYEPEEAARIVSLLSRERALERYLAEAEKHDVVPLTRITAAYPPQLAEKFGASCPPVLFARGDLCFCAGGVSRSSVPARFWSRDGSLHAALARLPRGRAMFSSPAEPPGPTWRRRKPAWPQAAA